jgi:hypothetical protein
MDQECWIDVCTYHDGEWGEVHRRTEDDAENSDDHGAALVGMCGHEHGAHDDDHEHGLHGEDAKYPQLQTQRHDHSSSKNQLSTKLSPWSTCWTTSSPDGLRSMLGRFFVVNGSQLHLGFEHLWS